MKRPLILLVGLTLVGAACGVALSAASPLGNQILGVFEASDDVPERVHRVASVDAGKWELKSYANQRGDKCIRQTVPGEGVGMTCLDPATMFADGRRVLVMPGARQRGDEGARLTWDNMWLYGFVSADVAALEVVNMDCSIEKIAFDDEGAFMHIVSATAIERGAIPHKVLARNQAGAVIYERNVRIGLPDNGKRAGLGEPRPKPECA